jgi:hypothetical protein
VVGAAVGGVIGGIEGVLGVDRQYYYAERPYSEHPQKSTRHHRMARNTPR